MDDQLKHTTDEGGSSSQPVSEPAAVEDVSGSQEIAARGNCEAPQTDPIDDASPNAPMLKESYDLAYERCEKAARRLDGAERRSVAALFEFLAEGYRSGEAASNDVVAFKSFCAARGKRCTMATLRNPYAVIIQAASPSIDDKTASRYGTALVYAKAQGKGADEIPEFLKEQGGIEGCVQAHRDAKKLKKPAVMRQAPKPAPAAGAVGDTELRISGAPRLPDGEYLLVVEVRDGACTYKSSDPLIASNAGASKRPDHPEAQDLAEADEPGAALTTLAREEPRCFSS